MSTVLYNIYTSDQPVTNNTIVVDYADDKVIMSTNADPFIATANLQYHLTLMDDIKNEELKSTEQNQSI